MATLASDFCVRCEDAAVFPMVGDPDLLKCYACKYVREIAADGDDEDDRRPGLG